MKNVEHPVSFRETWAEISLGAVSHNAALFKSNIKERCRLMAVVKANGYGHGAIEVAQAALAAGADYLGVAILDEALKLRTAGVEQPILVLGYTPPFAVETAVRNRVALTVFSEPVLDEMIACTERLHMHADMHLKIDTGMTRIGVATNAEALTLAQKALSSTFVRLEGLFTHFADADRPDSSYTRRQYERFSAVVQFLESHHIHVPIKHCCNSAAAMLYPEMHEDMIRVGIALYGLHPSAAVQHPDFPLRQAMQLKTKIAALKNVPKDQPVSYGCTYIPDRDIVTATIPIGYADGLSRQMSNKGYAIIRSQRVPIIGKVCMDQAMLNVTNVADVQVGDEVILFGGSEDAEDAFISIDEVAAHMNTINYEVVCLIGSRVPRVCV
ncbi:alanine racemase [Paenibacillus beijingensis]|uniref:Alanine racemase n=1 Tax=Paenibacillus beijingensis TaxID=1126833 RepID=A0A0D5NG80_9BACL|nr:alanine racemase [Paenibacillus beijingensis]AJY74399.1 alanine racemase [Paenibacillus beijingensis]